MSSFLYNNFLFEEFGIPFLDGTPGFQELKAWGYDPSAYITTAALAPAPYTTQALIQAKIGGQIRLIEACDDAQPPTGSFSDPGVQTVYNSVIQNVTTEINGYLSSVYPIPLMQIGTVAIFVIDTVSTDGNGIVQSIQMATQGNYLVAPGTTNIPAYLRQENPIAAAENIVNGGTPCQGTGLQLTVTYSQVPFTDESGQTIQINQVSTATPPVILDGGTGYNQNQVLILTGGSSIVPAKIREAAVTLICHDLYQRRFAPEEKNIFGIQAQKWRGNEDTKGFLTKIGEGDMQLDGTFRSNFSPVASWNSNSVLFGANSL